jgi:tetratricopeptide (TPR) repeat protein
MALLAILLHDLLDLAQATDRAPWWPWSDRRVGSDLGLLPTDSVREAVVFGLLLLAFLGLHRAFRGAVGRAPTGPRVRSAGSPAIRLGHAFIAVVVLAAALTHSLRDARERDLAAARTFVEQQSYAAGLAALARAERWPSTAKPGRIDYLRGEAYAGLGDRRRAEACYLRAYGADPAYFWAVADLAVFYASSNQPVTERRRLIAPYLRRLQTNFATHAALPQVLARVEQRLATPATTADVAPHQKSHGF